MAELKDSGNRREFETGAVRDMQEGKGRMDLVPWGVCSDLYDAMRKMFYDEYTGFVINADSEEHYTEAPVTESYPRILVEMSVMDSLLNPSHQDNALTPTYRIAEIKSRFLRMAAIFCLHHWNLMIVPDDYFDKNYLKNVGDDIVATVFGYAMLDVGKHYEDGARKYADNNWRKGMDVKIYFDSAVRHFMKFMSNRKDEPHDRAFLWNCLCGAWECDAELLKIRSDEYELTKCSTSDSKATVTSYADLGTVTRGID